MLFDTDDFDNHERIVFSKDATMGLTCIIAIHNTVYGPAFGGCRMWPYQNESQAVRDVLRLSRGMTYKNVMSELPIGGGKAVIIGDPRKDKSEALFEAFGYAVEQLHGSYITAPDVNVNVNDMEVVVRRTSHVSCLSNQKGGSGGDPAPKTAYGVYLGILAAVGFVTDQADLAQLKNVSVAVQGLGSVGYYLCRYLSQAGAELFVADIDEDRLDNVCAQFGAMPVASNDILSCEVDVLAPCALGAILNKETIPGIKASIVAGAANNQLATSENGKTLSERNILYAPDYIINAGGIINAAYEHFRLGDEQDVLRQIKKIRSRLTAIFEEARDHHVPTNVIADHMAQERITEKRKLLKKVA